MVRALVLMACSAALGLGLAGLMLHRRLPAADALRLQRATWVGLLAATVLQLVRIRDHGRVLLADRADAGLAQLMSAAAQTHVGVVLWAQCALLVFAGLCAWRRAGRSLVIALVASLVCAALAGHVAASGDSTPMSAVAVVHVLLVGLWFGGLPALWMLWRYRQPTGDGAEPLDRQALRAFSRWALPAMLLILASGVLLATQTVGRWPALVATPYGWLLLTKLGLVALVLTCAFVLRRRLAAARAGRSRARPASTGLKGSNGSWLTLEVALACGVMAAAGTLAGWVPAAHDRFDWPLGFRLAPQAAWYQRQDQLRWPLLGAAILGVLGLGAGAATWRRRRRFALVAGCGSIACSLALAVPALTVEAYPSTYHPAGAPYDSASVVAGARLYGALCAQCHGAHGHGDGPLAASLKPAPADLTAPHLGWHTHGDMYWWISHGFPGSSMPAFESRTTPQERWQIVNHLMALSLGYQARTLAERPVPDAPWLAAINFRYPTPDGGFAQLSELQLNATVLLVLIRDAAELPRLRALHAQARSLAASGLKVIVVLGPAAPWPDAVPANLDVVRDADGDILAAWSNYRRTLAQPDFRDEAPEPARLEVLVDRYGYVRARWRADEGAGAPTTDALRAALETLAKEPAFVLADVHAH